MSRKTLERVVFATLGALGAFIAVAYHDLYQQHQQKKQGSAIKPITTPQPPPVTPSPTIPLAQKIRAAKESILPFGFAGPINDTLYRTAYISSYNRQLRNPNWVAEHITNESLTQGDGVERTKSTFREDFNIPEKFRATLKDYFRSGYDRGHLVPAADVKFSQEAMDETFFLTNISPQVGDGFNRDYWSHLEEFCRRLVRNEGFKDVYVFSGPLYLPKQEDDGKWYVKYEVIGQGHNVAVPNHFFKVILATKDNQKYALGAFILPNRPIPNHVPLQRHEVPLDVIERAAGLTFFELLDKEAIAPLCTVSKCVLVAHPKYLKQKNLKALPQPGTEDS
ncbi:11962_t:CDS:2 [Ambispora leptoticha]|uniref:Endonuclease n=1 Tax=Ambispora leptoticha TaxID=144679 RepID=A0A9N9FFU5_9GLOM|nr:11962_t:CDS:2 [Ambispora leptoticha]